MKPAKKDWTMTCTACKGAGALYHKATGEVQCSGCGGKGTLVNRKLTAKEIKIAREAAHFEHLARLYKTPVGLAVGPAKIDAMKRARDQAKNYVEGVKVKLKECDWDANKYAPYPPSTLDRFAWRVAYEKYNTVRSLTEWDHARMQSSRRMGDPEYVKIVPKKVTEFIEKHARDAGENYDQYVFKLVIKVGEHTKAVQHGSHVWDYSYLTVTDQYGTEQLWKTQRILNRSVYGLEFDQWPTRIITKIDRKVKEELRTLGVKHA